MAKRLVNRILPDLHDGRAVLAKLAQLVWLDAVWVMLWGRITPGNIAAGLLVGAAILLLLPLPPVPVEGRVHIGSLLKLVIVFVGDMIKSSVQVAWLALRPGPPPMSAVLRAKVEVKSDLVLTLLVDMMNLIPGTMVLDIDTKRRLLYVHVVDVSSEKAVRQFYRSTARLERLCISAFERDNEWHASPMHGVDDEEYHRVSLAERTRLDARAMAQPEIDYRRKKENGATQEGQS
ncbi:Cation antiporter OS=Tsukamurella paurometabola (strain ATCC 8368 / DSM / CCUG 35730 / CIP 100753/ JCM 10117 / KCTC 9821 / NBRC 16120 / NCIMB 702349 /NCTC 13040) OX=521096 GN=Tpau_3717 PE=3 SV=1 [Tsukamurella paurometabola]|uniref:Cation antiporter n=1 Tax=Tsukamurella paurometabola (strain ATCC 8368 / DSM 20162 / CCUG 35730 / CIP 100753 / JCM 10117 / KCTC 9821 / NBRC 16120 / NCIMB 702349 / NCTC 13040) TaxID=521096 RepID=D5UYJ2_TSUPD|nr:Na+/H+ antiporter subunit E [Tsukamurella paurometabola]ADG80295.1 cation antiporter [Tsukamurella paurometabola DSM 20162]SUP39172.1 Mrp complex subunit E1 [Tsukamurella paurometabola]